jgi:hypothetical protein
MSAPAVLRNSPLLPLPKFILRPFTALIIAVMHVYLALAHIVPLVGGDWTWTHIWKGFGALAGAYIFAALVSRGLRSEGQSVPRGASRAST